MSAATADVAAARQGVKEAQSNVDGMEKVHASVVTEKSAREAFLSDTWAPLKDHTLPPTQWRRRNKMVDEVMHLLESLDAEKSLQAALVIAFKQKVGERKFYASTAVRMGEEILEKSVVDFNSRIANFDLEKNEASEKVKAEEARVAAEVVAEQARIEEAKEAGKQHLEASEALRVAEKETEAAACQAKELQRRLVDAQAKLDSISASLARLDDLIEREVTVAPSVTSPSSADIGTESIGEPSEKVQRVEPNE
jgi:wobble nucleotide-excising tRNase